MATVALYYNRRTGSSTPFALHETDTGSFDFSGSIKEQASAQIDAVMREISKYGKSLDFPQELLEVFRKESEVDMFLLAAYDKRIGQALKKCIYIPIPDLLQRMFRDIHSDALMNTQAIGIDSMIAYNMLEERKEFQSILFEELESDFIAYNIPMEQGGRVGVVYKV